MGKVTKILGNIISAVVLLLIFVPMLVAVVVELPVVQNMIVDKLTNTLENNTGVKVDVGHVRIDFLGNVSVEDFYVEDFQHDTLIYASLVRTSLSNFIKSNTGNGIVLKDGAIVGTRMFLRETPEGVMNVKQVLDKLSKKKKNKKPFAVNVEDVRIEDLYLVIERREHRNPEYGVDYGNMRIDDISADVEQFHLQGTIVEGVVSNFKGREQSGFDVKSMSGRFHIDRGVVDLRDMYVQTEESELSVEHLRLEAEDWTKYKYFITSVDMLGVVNRSHVTTDDIAYFAPKMRSWKSGLDNAEIEFDGRVVDLNVNVKHAEFGNRSSFSGRVNLKGLPDVKNTIAKLDLHHLTTNRADAEALFTGISRKRLPEGVLAIVERAGRIDLAGTFSGGLYTFVTEADLRTAVGNAKLSARKQLQPIDDNVSRESSLTASADVQQMNIGALLGVRNLGMLTAKAGFNGRVANNMLVGAVDGDVASVGFNAYNYQQIDIRGNVINKSFIGRVQSDDEALKLSLDGKVDMNGEQTIYDMKLDLEHADLRMMNFNQRDSLSQLTLRADLFAIGKTLDDVNGSLIVERGATYRYNDSTLTTQSDVSLNAQNAGQYRELVLGSEYLDASFIGPTSYAEVMGYLREAMHKYLPGLPSFTRKNVVLDEDGYSRLNLTVKNIDPLLSTFADGWKVGPRTNLTFLINPSINLISLQLNSDFIENMQRHFLTTKVNVNVRNEGDSLAMYVQTNDFYTGFLKLPSLSVVAGAKNDKVELSAMSNSLRDSLSASVNLLAQLGYNKAQRRSLTIDVLPTKIRQGGKTWDIHGSRVVMDSMRIDVRNFVVSSGEQQLHLNGVASYSPSDSLTLQLRDFSLTPFTTIVERMGYHVKGSGNGEASMKAVLDLGEFTADIAFDDISVNDVAVAPMKLDSRWDFRESRARVVLRNMRTQSDVVTGFYAPSSKRYFAKGVFDNIPLAMLDSLLRGVVCSTEGVARAELTIQGKGREASLNGGVEVKDLSTMVDFTRVRYNAPTAHIEVKDNHLTAKGVKVYDEEHNVGEYEMDVSLQHLSNVSFNVSVRPHKMIVLNTTQHDNDLFYGKIYASGVASITGSKSGTRLDISGSTEGDSHFYMPLSGKSDVSTADFVIFQREGVRSDTMNYLVRKRMMFERRNRPASSAASNMEINIELEANTNTEAQLVIDPTVGDIIKARGSGTLNLRIVPRDNIFTMYGDYRISEGSYLFTLQNIVNKLFEIEDGSTIQWTGQPMDARLDINAVYKLRASLQPLLASTTLENVTRAVPVECIINLTDRLSNPSVLFDIKVPNADAEIQAAVANLLNNQQSIATQFMYLLVSGSFYSDQSSSSSMGANASAMTGFELLSNQLSNWLSSDDYNIVLRYRPRSELTSDEIDFGFSKSLVNNRLLVELEGNYMVDNKMKANSNMSNFMGEAYITWLIDQAGTLKLKGFTQTIDRFDENQGLQETGLGIYYKEDFNNWADLKRRVSDRFMSKRRREARDAALEAMESGEPYDTTALMTRKEQRQLRRAERRRQEAIQDSLKQAEKAVEVRNK